ncbi:hypothetical protein [Rugamonas sp. DEMB1]|uniref:hypothetical protein n=1 Tax=Rugamonas sp. DEMB1 TaxID=3039386 RepID=UPI00244D6FB1|nr:hypothetical protein [Rugamonas sp. DEMB1]WGG51807.1 hypothetical protein QC826_06190 [Rugamonas sp. DEMB1]
MQQSEKRKPKHKLPLTLPVQFGLNDGSNAHLLVDAKSVVFGNLFGIMHHLSVSEARADSRSSRGVRTAEFLVHAMNAHDLQSLALRKIAATSSSKRITQIALDALKKAGEL